MIQIEYNGLENPKEIYKYRVNCDKCDSIFTCDTTDMSRRIYEKGEVVDAIECPICHNLCVGGYGNSSFYKLEKLN